MRRLAAALLLLFAAAACGSPAPEPSDSPTVPAALNPGTQWLLVGPAAIKGDVTITFDEDQLSGQAPVNRYFGPFTATDDGRIDIGVIASTEMAGDPDLMAAEQKYYELLGRVDAFDSDGMQLTLRAGDETVLQYAQEGSPAVFGRTLVGMKVAEARAQARAAGYDFRVVSVDGDSRPVTMDYNPQRLNATVVNGRVTELTAG